MDLRRALLKLSFNQLSNLNLIIGLKYTDGLAELDNDE